MATSIITDFDSIYLTSHLPEEVSFETDAASLKIDVYVNNRKVFTSDYYPFNEEVTIRDIRSIVEAAMTDWRLTMTTMKIVATEPKITKTNMTYDEDGNMTVDFDEEDEEPECVTSDSIKIIYSRLKSSDTSDDFLKCSFLTTRKSALVPKGGQVNLSNYTRAYAVGSNIALIYYSRTSIPGKIFTFQSIMGKMQSETEKIITACLTYQHFKQIVDKALGYSCNVHGVEYQIGGRYFNIYFTDEEPTDVFSFLNAFNIEERFYLYGATTVKTEVDRNEAVCGVYTQFYDEKVKVKYEVETTLLNIDEAKWLNQMLTSSKVTHALEDGSFEEVLISDITSEVSNSDKDLVRLKFSWKYADGNERI